MAAVMKHDKFCWVCTDSATALKCLNCVRSFHSKCIGRRQQSIDKEKNWLCPVCTDSDAAKGSDDKACLDTLPTMINCAIEDERFAPLSGPLNGPMTNFIVNPIDLTMIKDKIQSYDSFTAFLADVQWIVHNCCISFPDKHDMVNKAKELVEYLEDEIETAEMCAECYMHDFSLVCTKPHLIVWAKWEECDHWPAKVMSIDGQLVNVRFFGDHTQADVPASNCLLYSETDPLLAPSPSYQSALNEANQYLENLRTKFGSYHLSPDKTVFEPTMLQRYLQQLIPGAFNSQEASNDSEPSTDCSSDSIVNATETYQIHYDPDSSTTAEGVCKELTIVLPRLNPSTYSGGASKRNDNAKNDHEPTKKRARFVKNNDGGRSSNCDAENETWYMAECQAIMTGHMINSTKAFHDYLSKLNAELARTMAAKYDQHIKSLEERNQLLVCDGDDKKLIDQLKKKIRQLETEVSNLKSEYSKMIESKEEEKMKAVDEAKKQCKLKYTRLLENADSE
ncbi:MYND-type zinc finger-containing chromatin reader Zmynd8-like [Sitodiplosis mosellana]|uniref:MYND-type zinc finger-containing chromatin reader Zmynd8-like n=1 Tax=Sitodiplosis mosellana TaxID=263140 RepID=UPI002444101C|nr:MYND-type zinc finger-containing chromatin reader Zmynd8-like [Sitodiplosis mosellana]